MLIKIIVFTNYFSMNAIAIIPNTTVQNDFFAPMYSYNGLNQLMFTIVIVSTAIGLILMSGIVWYERHGNHRCRTAINQLFSTLVWIVISYIILVYIPEGIRYLQGPLNASFCDFHNFMKNFLPNCFLLTLDCIILIRHIFIFKLSNFAVVNDDLIVRFLNLSIILVSFWLSLMKRMSQEGMPLNYHMCTGSKPNDSQKSGSKTDTSGNFNTTVILVCFSFLLHAFILTKIFLYERKMEKTLRGINLGTLQDRSSSSPPEQKVAWSTENTIDRFPNLSKSMIDFTTQLLCLLLLVGVAIVNTVKNATKLEELNETQNHWYAYSQQAGFAIAIIGIPLVYYGRKKYISSTIWRRVVDLFR